MRIKREKYWYEGFEADPSDNRKSVMVHPRPGGVHVHPDAQVEASALNGLLVDAMNGSVASADGFTAKLIEHHVFFHFSNQSPSVEGMESSDPSRQPFEKVFEQERDRFLQRVIQPWLLVYANAPAALRAGERTDALIEADGILAMTAVQLSWPDVFTWQGRVKKQQDGTYALCSARAHLRGLAFVRMCDDHERIMREFHGERRCALRVIDILRERVRWLWILCEELRLTPVRIASGAQQPRRVTRHIVHPAQTQQDALNEFAASLVNPPQRFVAHVRSPGGYHQVRLVPPVHGPEYPDQPQQVRLRSQQRYPCPEETREGSAAPGTRPASQAPPTISRRPGGWQEHSNDDTAENDEDTA